MSRSGAAMVLGILLALLGGGDAESASFGRVSILVMDTAGKPLPGVEIEVLCPPINFTKKLVTNKKGKATLSAPDPTERYELRIAHEGFQPYQVLVKPDVGQTIAKEIQLTPVAPVPRASSEPVSAAAHDTFNLGVEAARSGDREAAKKKFLEALEIEPDLASAHLALASIYLETGEDEAGLEMSERFLALQPGNVEMLQLRWEVYRELGDTEKEKQAFQALAAVDTGFAADDVVNKAAKLFDAGDVAGARAGFETALELDPDHASAHYRLALCLISFAETEPAKDHLERFLELAPDHPEAANARDMLGYLQ